MNTIMMEAVFNTMDELKFTPNFGVCNIPVVSESDIIQLGEISEWPVSFSELLSKIEENEIKIKYKYLRIERDKKLKATDQYGLSDFPFKTEEIKQAWFTYRQQLRDLPQNSLNISLNEQNELVGVEWPTPPE
jgi:hypothetical protein